MSKGTYYLGKYLFLREQGGYCQSYGYDFTRNSCNVTKDRVKFNRTKSISIYSISVLLINIKSGEEIVFESLGKCIKFFLSQGLPVSQATLS